MRHQPATAKCFYFVGCGGPFPTQKQITVAPSALPLSHLCGLPWLGLLASEASLSTTNRVNGALYHAKSSGVMKIGYLGIASTTADSNLNLLRGVGFSTQMQDP